MPYSDPSATSATGTISGTIFRAAAREDSVRRKTPGSLDRFQRSCDSLAGGVSTGLRRSARPYPLFMRSGSGAHIQDVDGNTYCDYAMGWGPLILGHAPSLLVDAVTEQLSRGFTYGCQHDLEYEVAERLIRLIPCADLVCFASSGTEIVQLALRLARAATGRTKYVKFEGHYHGWADSVLMSYHPTLEELGRAQGNPVGAGLGQLPPGSVTVAEWNNRESVEKIFSTHLGEISAVICEPVLCNSGCIPPDEGFLQFLRDITVDNGAVLIFDEVITGFRLGLGGAQERYGVIPDLATYAKAVGAGMPLSVLAGKRDYMDLIASGKVVHAGTLNGNPVALASAKAALDFLAADSGAVYAGMHRRGEKLRLGLERMLRSVGLPAVTNGEGAVFHISFQDRMPRTYRDTLAADTALYSDFALALLDEGVLVLPDGRWYLSAAHTEEDIDATLAAARRAVS
jgi:glutamate-1-semialdehyde 2,1-aminomutase